MGQVWTPSKNKRIIVCLHGAESHQGWFGPFSRHALATKIWSEVIAEDRSGWRGDVPSAEAAFTWIASGLKKAELEDSQIDVVATSWGGLAALAYFLDGDLKGWNKIASLHLVTPSVYSHKKFLARILWRACTDFLRGGGILSGRVGLTLTADDFSQQAPIIDWIAADPLRNREVSPRFLRVTSDFQNLVRKGLTPKVFAGKQVYLHVPAEDPVIDLGKTEALMLRGGAQIIHYPSRRHGLVLDHPEYLVEAMAAGVGGAPFQLEVFHRRSPFRFRVRHAHGDRFANDSLVIRISGGTNYSGVGEALPRNYVTGETIEGALEQAPKLFEQLAVPIMRLVVAAAQSPDHINALDTVDGSDAIADALLAAWRQASALSHLALWSAFDIALIDWLTKVLGITVQDFVAQLSRRSGLHAAVENQSSPAQRATIPMIRPALAGLLALAYRMAGFKLLKVKVGDKASVPRVRAVLRILDLSGSGANLTMDANQGYSPAGAQEFISVLANGDENFSRQIAAFEDPVQPSDAPTLAAFARGESSDGHDHKHFQFFPGKNLRQPQFSIMADEALSGENSCADFARHPEIRIWNLRVGKCGGITGMLAAAAHGAQCGAQIAIGALVGEDRVLDRAARLVEKVIPAAWSERSFSEFLLRDRVFRSDKTQISDASGSCGGLGLVIDERKIRQHLVTVQVYFAQVHAG